MIIYIRSRTTDAGSLDIGMPVSEDDNDNETENEDAFTVYECPGLGSVIIIHLVLNHFHFLRSINNMKYSLKEVK